MTDTAAQPTLGDLLAALQRSDEDARRRAEVKKSIADMAAKLQARRAASAAARAAAGNPPMPSRPPTQAEIESVRRETDAMVERMRAQWAKEHAEFAERYYKKHAAEIEAQQREEDERERERLVRLIGTATASKPRKDTPRAGRLIDTLAYPPRGMDADHAAAYLGLGVTKFREMVAADLLPPPIDLDGSPRWDRARLDRAFDDLKDKRTDPHSAGRARIKARLDVQKAAHQPSADIVKLERKP